MKNNFGGLSREESAQFSRIITMGAQTKLPIIMSPGELARLIGVIYSDTGMHENLAEQSIETWEAIRPPSTDYFHIPEDWFTKAPGWDRNSVVALWKRADAEITDFLTYLRCLAELHKRRRKYSMILSAQPLPTMVQVAPRSLVEYGSVEPEVLASWLTWRKFFYDLDNRSAQETGYLFEPILAAALGGVPQSQATSLVSRTADGKRRRQVDCWIAPIGETPLAYEFKMRVTIAASGQGRFGEELDFARDCHSSGVIPVLLVLDPTPNARLTDLEAEYRKFGGHAFVGDAAWEHLEKKSGAVMAMFIEKYVRAPISEVSAFEAGGKSVRLLDLGAMLVGGELQIRLGDHHPRSILRREDPSLGDSDAGEEGNGAAK